MQFVGGEILKEGIALATGELVKDEYFTLFESVGALEVRIRLEDLIQKKKKLRSGIDHGSKDGQRISCPRRNARRRLRCPS